MNFDKIFNIVVLIIIILLTGIIITQYKLKTQSISPTNPKSVNIQNIIDTKKAADKLKIFKIENTNE